MNPFLICSYSFLTFPSFQKQTNKTINYSHWDVSHFWYFYSLDMDVFVIYYFIVQATYIITYKQMQSLKYMLIRAFSTNRYRIHIRRQGKVTFRSTEAIERSTHEFQNANTEDISPPHPHPCYFSFTMIAFGFVLAFMSSFNPKYYSYLGVVSHIYLLGNHGESE